MNATQYPCAESVAYEGHDTSRQENGPREVAGAGEWEEWQGEELEGVSTSGRACIWLYM